MNAFKHVFDKPHCFLHNPSKPFKSLHSALQGGNASVVNYVFSFRHKTPFSNPLTESIESGSQSTIREALGRKKIEVCTIVLKEFAIKLFKAQALGEALY